jgi:uroporphyrinogen decarboxylase
MITKMTPRERVLTTLRHEEPDSVPLDFGGMHATGIHANAYHRLREFLGMPSRKTRILNAWMQLAVIEDEIRDRFGVDLTPVELLRPAFGLSIAHQQPYALPDGSEGEISSEYSPNISPDGSKTLSGPNGRPFARMPAGGFWFDVIDFPLENATTTGDIDKFDWEGLLLKQDELAFIQEQGRRLHEHSDRAVIGNFGGAIFDWSQQLRGFSNVMFDLVENQDLYTYLLDRMTEVHLENLRRYLDAVGEYIHIVAMGDDLGTQNGPWMRPEVYRTLIKPRHARIFNYIKESNPHLYVFLHSCGSIYQLLPDLIDAGVDIINPIQVTANGMEPSRLKREFGKNLTLWGGGVDSQGVLPFGTPHQVREQVKERIQLMAPGGGYVFATVHNIQAEVPPENIVAMFEAVAEYGQYPMA